uniref:ATP synthase F0 subunit 8 n=1 Tax=Dindymus rubiginosus TaxID=1906767 RepID=A0A4Y1JVY4_9HEMI|nr:ATP synthase F0 subunit 8 [Dindymus rubiginosus]APO08939.1 ATP synthase F0 subunit 8 [Dindymus rubiginosus]
MPQMAPLWWEMIYMTITSMLILMSILIYHNNMMNPTKTYKNKKYNFLTWKW